MKKFRLLRFYDEKHYYVREFESCRSLSQYLRRSSISKFGYRKEMFINGQWMPFTVFGSKVVSLQALLLKVRELQSNKLYKNDSAVNI